MISDEYVALLENENPEADTNMALIKKIEENGNDDDRWKLVINNCRLVSNVLSRHSIHITNETFSDGLWGMYFAVKNLKNVDHNGQFVYYSKKCIHGYVVEGLKRRSTQLSPRRRNRSKHIGETSLNAPVEGDEAGHDLSAFAAVGNDPLVVDPIEAAIERDNTVFFKKVFNEVKVVLDDREEQFLCAMIKHSGNLISVSKEIGVCRQSAYNIKDRVRVKIIEFLETKNNLDIKTEFDKVVNNYKIKKGF